MLKLFVAAAQLAVPLSLMTAVLLANRPYAPTRRQRVGRWTVAALGGGLLAAAVIVALRLTTSWIRLPMVTLWSGTVLILAQLAFLAALWLPGTDTLLTDRQRPTQVLLRWVALACLALTGLYHGIPLAMASDAVVPMGGTLFDTEAILNLLGYLLGLVVAVLAGALVVVSLGRVPTLARRLITTAVLLLATIALWVPLYQQFASVKLVPRNSLNFTTLLWLQRNAVTVLLIQTVLAMLPALAAALVRSAPVPVTAPPAQHRLVRADRISRRRFLGMSAATGVLLGVTFTVGKQLAEAIPELSPIEESVLNGDHVEVAIDAVNDGHLHRFAYTSSTGTEVRFIVIQKNSSNYGTGLDACEICGPGGYYERDGRVVCRKCDVVMNIQTIGFAGGCNPIPLAHELHEGKIRFAIADLERNAKVFA